MNNTTKLSFTEHWQYPSAVEREIKGCEYSETKKTERKFNSGRDIYRTTFYDVCNEAIESRKAMQLISKNSGESYYVCESTLAIARRTPPSGADVIADMYG